MQHKDDSLWVSASQVSSEQFRLASSSNKSAILAQLLNWERLGEHLWRSPSTGTLFFTGRWGDKPKGACLHFDVDDHPGMGLLMTELRCGFGLSLEIRVGRAFAPSPNSLLDAQVAIRQGGSVIATHLGAGECTALACAAFEALSSLSLTKYSAQE